MAQALLEASLNLPLLARGKVRDIYATDARDPHSPLLFIATDRISAFDHVLGSPIPEKGRILTQLSLFWFHFLAEIVPNHLISADVATFPPILAQTRKTDGEIETIETSDNAISLPPALAGRTMLVKRAQMFPVECVVRGYLSGSGWKDYQATSASGQPSVCGVALPRGLRESDRLPEPIFTPAAKINTGGHDENISFASVVQTIGEEYANRLRELSLSIYARASAHAASKGVILADTKFEFGIVPGPGGTPQITLADEVLTPDSSRYWPVDQYKPGGPTPSFDKQYVRDYLESIHWNKQVPAPALPDDVVAKTRDKYLQAYELLTGRAEL
jgi:phosphoribosylaminoimidazole-succinocarboxamide synthase